MWKELILYRFLEMVTSDAKSLTLLSGNCATVVKSFLRAEYGLVKK